MTTAAIDAVPTEVPTPPKRAEARDWRGVWGLVRKFLPYARPYSLALAWASVLVVLRIATDLIQPWPLKIVIDHVLRNRPLHIRHLSHVAHATSHQERLMLLGGCCAFIIVRALLDGLFTYLSSARLAAIGQRVIFDVRRSLFDHAQRLSLGFYQTHRTGDLVTRFTGDSNNIEDMLVSVIGSSLISVLTVAGILAIMLAIHWQLTLVALVITPALFGVTRYYSARVRAAARERRRKEGDIASLLQEDLSSMRLIQAFTRERHESARFAAHAGAARDAGIRATELQARFAPMTTVITAAGTAAVVYFGARSVLEGTMTLGTMIVLITYLRNLYSPIKSLARLVNVVSRAAASAERVSEVLDAEPEVSDAPGAGEIVIRRGEVVFDRVSYAYPARDSSSASPTVLNDISLTVPAGATVAVVGPTGAGKSTLVGLLPRFHDPVSGSVRVDGRDLRDFRLDSLRRQISILPQEAVLFHATVWENIAFGSDLFPPGYGSDWLRANPEEGRILLRRVVAAANEANAHEFIQSLPEGYDSIVGERGASLSGGQRQRIAIARAMIRNAPLLSLDEPTTGLDAESEHAVMEAIDRLKAGRTTFIIAHRLSTIFKADQIVVIEHGRITEVGDHAQLVRNQGRYRRFLDLQIIEGDVGKNASGRPSSCFSQNSDAVDFAAAVDSI